MSNGRKIFNFHLAVIGPASGCTARCLSGIESNKIEASSDAAKSGYDARKTGKVLVDYNGAKVPWASQTRIYTQEGKVRGANLVWDTYPRLDVEQVASESHPKYASSIDRYC